MNSFQISHMKDSLWINFLLHMEIYVFFNPYHTHLHFTALHVDAS